MVICLERGADLQMAAIMAQLMPLPLTVSCFSKIQIGFTFLVPAHLGSPGIGPLNGCVCVCDLSSFTKLPHNWGQLDQVFFTDCISFLSLNEQYQSTEFI